MRPRHFTCYAAVLVAAVLCGRCNRAGADEKVFVVSAPAGTYLLSVTPAGKITLVELSVVKPDPADKPPPPKPPPEDDALTPLGKISRGAAAAVNAPAAAAELARIWQAAAESRAGTFAQKSQAARVAQSLYLQQTGTVADWSAWQAAVDEEIIRLATSGFPLTEELLREISAGLAAASGAARDGMVDGVALWFPVLVEILRGIISGEKLDFGRILAMILDVLTAGAEVPTGTGGGS